ncbi:MAG: Hsp20/alpha crystallin family protein [Gemmatimonadaceae bacterium]
MFAGRSLNSTLDRMLTLNRVLDEALAGSLNGSSEAPSWVPALDVVERHDAYLIALEIPGSDPSTIDISFEKNVLTVRGSKAMGFELGKDTEYRVYSSERVVGNFERSVRLPDFVDGERITAEFTHGVLFLTVPKVQAAQPRKITVKV